MGLKINNVELNIGTQVFAVHKQYVEEKINGARIKVCKVKTFENRGGEILPVLKEIGQSKYEIDPKSNYLYYTLDAALEAISTRR